MTPPIHHFDLNGYSIRQIDSGRREQQHWRFGKNFHDVQTVLALRINDRAHGRDFDCALLGPESSRDL